MKKQKRMHRFMEDRKYGNGKITGCPTKTLGHDRQCGFTLVELVITIAIVIILSVISVPIYQGYTRKAKFAEAYALCGTILSAHKAYYSEYGNFLKDIDDGDGGLTCYNTILGIDARGNKYFTWFKPNMNDMLAKYLFAANIRIPADLRIGGKTELIFSYNITSGGTFYER